MSAKLNVEDMVIFLSGPMRGYPALNHVAFHSYEEWLRNYGFTVISPVDHDHEIGINPEDEDFDVHTDTFGTETISTLMAWCLTKVLREATMVALMGGWEQSKGALAEIAAAKAVGIPVFEIDRPGERLLLLSAHVTVKLNDTTSPVAMLLMPRDTTQQTGASK